MLYDGKKITSLCVSKDWSMAELARRAGISQPSLWALEHQRTKKPKHETLARVSVALSVPLSEIMSESNKTPVADFSEIYRLLNTQNQNAIMAAAKAILKQQK